MREPTIYDLEIRQSIKLLKEVKAKINYDRDDFDKMMNDKIAMIAFDEIARTKFWHSKSSVNIADHHIAAAWGNTTNFCDAIDAAIRNLKRRLQNNEKQ